jgi:heptosyltransferase-2
MQQPRHILIRGPNWTGDLIMASPGFRALRAAFPEARIILHVQAGLAPLVDGSPWFDEIVPVGSYQQGPLAHWREGRSLRAHGPFDLGICLPDSFAAALVMRFAGVRRVLGYRRGWRRWLLHDAIPFPSEAGTRGMLAREKHVLGLVEAAGASSKGTELELHATDEERSAAADALAERGIAPGTSYAVIAPGASYGPSKCWPARSFARVGDQLIREGVQVAVIGSPGECELTSEVVAEMEEKGADLGGALTLGGLKAVMERAEVLVCNDAGARHVAVAFGVPCVVMMGPTALEKTNMNLDRVSVLTADVACRPCYKRDCPIDHRCMTRIPPEEVAAEAIRALGQGAAFVGEQQMMAGGPA